MTQEQLKLLQKYRRQNFEKSQLAEIELAIKDGLIEEEIDMFANLNFEASKMYIARLAIKDNLTKEQIDFIINGYRNWYDMEFIRTCYKHNVPQNEIENMLHKIDFYLLAEFVKGLKHNLTLEQVKSFIDENIPTYEVMLNRLIIEGKLTEDEKIKILNSRLDETLIYEIGRGLDKGLSLKDTELYAKRGYNKFQMEELQLLLEYNLTAEPKLTDSQIWFVANSNLNADEMAFVRLCYEKNIPENEMKEILRKNLEFSQIEQINYGLQNDLSLDEIKIYAKHEFHWLQAEQIRLAIENKLTKEQIEFIANPNLEWQEMKLMKVCYELNISQSGLDELFNYNLAPWQINELAIGLENGLTLDDIKLYAKSNMQSEQMREIRLLLEYNLSAEEKITQEQFNFIINHKFNSNEMKLIRVCFQYDISQNEIENSLLNRNLDKVHINAFISGLENGLTINEAKLYTNPEYDYHQMEELRLGLEHKLSTEEVTFYSNPDFKRWQMYQIRLLLEWNATLENKYTLEDFNFITPEFNSEQLMQIMQGLKDGLTLNEVKIYAKPNFNHFQMKELRTLLKYNQTRETKLTEEQINFAANAKLKKYEIELIRVCYEKNIEQKEIKNLLNKNLNEYQIEEVILCLKNNPTIDQIKFIANPKLPHYEMNFVKNCYERKIPQNKIEDTLKIIRKYNYNKCEINIIESSLIANLKMDEIKFIAKLNDLSKMNLAQICFERNIPQNEINELLKQNFEEYEIDEIYKGLKNGLPLEKVKIYAKPEFMYNQMEEIRLGLEYGLSIDEVKTYANPKYICMKMRDMRKQLEQEHKQNRLFEEIVNSNIKTTIEQNNEIEQNSLKDEIDNNPPDVLTKGDKLGGGLDDR